MLLAWSETRFASGYTVMNKACPARYTVMTNVHPNRYAVMQRCWELEADRRPTFSQLVEQIGSLVTGFSPDLKPFDYH